MVTTINGNDSTKKNVIVMGCGIGGLTAAHYLNKHGFNVTIFERHETCGGLARSREYDREGRPVCPAELSWRAMCETYHNLLSLMKEIPYPEPGNEEKTVFDHLVPTSSNIYTQQSPSQVVRTYDFDVISMKNRLKLLRLGLRHLLSYHDRNVEEESSIRFYDTLKEDLNEAEYDNLIQSLSAAVGQEPEKAALFEIMHYAEIYVVPSAFVGWPTFYVLNQPSNMSWFGPWTKHLKSKNVQIHTNSVIREIKMKNATAIDYIMVNNTKYSADYYVSSVSLDSLVSLTPPELKETPTFKNLVELDALGSIIQFSVNVYLSKKVKFIWDTGVPYLAGSPWGMQTEFYGSAWGPNVDIPERCGNGIRDILSLPASVWDKPGLLFNKTFMEMTYDEIAKDAWYQVMSDRGFVENVEVEGSNSTTKLTLDDVELLGYHIYDVIARKEGSFREPKFVNNNGTMKLRPKARTEVSNLFIGTAYAETTSSVHSQEGATEGGMWAAHEILRENNIDLPVHQTKRLATWFFGIPRLIDAIMFHLNLPSLSNLLGDPVLVLLLYLSFYLFCLWRFVRLIIRLVFVSPKKLKLA